MKRWSLFDLFLAVLILLAALAFYFSFINPLRFSHLIQREGVTRYAAVEILLPDDLAWMKGVLPEGEESRNVYGQLDWKALHFEEVSLGGRKMMKLTAKVLMVEEASGILRYGKYTLVTGGKIFLINDRYLLEGRILGYRLLDEKIQL